VAVTVTAMVDPMEPGAAYRPDGEIVPADADHATAVLPVPVTVAANWRVCPA
jgi:hypothetical protein